MHKPNPTSPNKRQRGFTLIEIMIVLIVIGLGMGMALVSVKRSGTGERINTETQRLKALIDIALDEAMLQSQEYGLRVDENGYKFLVMGDDEKWTEVANDEFLRPREMPAGVEIILERDDRKARDAFNFQEIDEDAPQIMIYSSGEITPFTMEFRNKTGEQKMRVRGLMQGQVDIETSDAKS